jgi:hypothetical protein
LQNILNITATGLTRVSVSRRADIEKKVEKEEKRKAKSPTPDSQPEYSGQSEAENPTERKDQHHETSRKQRSLKDVEAVESTPIVVIKNFAAIKGGERSDEVLEVISRWAANLAENQVYLLIFYF